MGGPFNALVHDKYGISFSVYYYEHFIMVAPYVKVIAVNGVFPGRTTISDGTYPLIAEVFSAIRADLPAEHNARKLRDWLLSQEGQQVIAESGYVSIGNP
jgi:phosphate transport system substrate-binding protein